MSHLTATSTYDIIIVGYGTTSSCIVEKLKQTKLKVLVINQGPLIEDDNVKYLKNFNTVWKNPKYTSIVGVSETNNNVTQGRIFGGSSMHNGCVAIAPTENFKGDMGDDFDDKIPIEVNAIEYKPNILTDTISKYFNIPTSINHNNYNYSISPTAQMFLKPNGIERSMVTSLLVDMPSNIEFLQGYCDKVNIDEDMKVTSVNIIINGQSITIQGSKVIISAGINSSTILERSGIGSKKILNNANINCLIDNHNVGENVKNQVGPSLCLRFPNSYKFNSNNLGIVGMGFTKNEKETKRKYQLMITKHAFIANQVEKIFKLDGCISINMCDLDPKSSGSIHIVDSNHETQPLIDLCTYSNEDDIKSGGDSLQHMYEIYEELKKNIDVKLVFPTYEMLSNMSTKDILDVNSLVSEHYTSSCRMGKSIEDSVVNMLDYEVHGVSGLHVCDASIFPYCPDGNPQYSCLLLGMKLGRIITENII